MVLVRGAERKPPGGLRVFVDAWAEIAVALVAVLTASVRPLPNISSRELSMAVPRNWH